MASAPFSHLILFIASMIVAANVAGGLVTEVSTVQSAIEDQSLDVSKQLRTDVSIINDPSEGTYNLLGNGNITVYVKNTGSRTLPNTTADIDVLFDGTYQSGLAVTVLGGGEWTPGATIEVTFNHADPGTGEHRVKVTVVGAEDTFVYRR